MTKKSKVSESQYNNTYNWLVNYTTINREEFINTGVEFTKLYADYKAGVKFPLGYKSFIPIVRKSGLERVVKSVRTFYILNV